MDGGEIERVRRQRHRRNRRIAAFLRDVTTRFEELRALRRELAALKPQTGHG